MELLGILNRHHVLMFSTTQTTEASRRGSEQIEQTSLSEMLWQTLQYFTSCFTRITASAKLSTSSVDWRSRCKTRRRAVLRPTPGNCEKASTARSKSWEGYCCMLFTILSDQRDEGKRLPWQSVPLVSNSRISHQSTRDTRSAYPLPLMVIHLTGLPICLIVKR